jgi:hypothetical protein
MAVLLIASIVAFHFGLFDPGRVLAMCGMAAGLVAPLVCGLLSPEEDVGSGRMLIVMLGGVVVNVLLFVAWGIAFIHLIWGP